MNREILSLKIRNAAQKAKKKMIAVQVAGTMALCSAYPVSASVSGVTDKIDLLKSFVIAVISGIGVIVLAYNVWNLSQAHQNNDPASTSQAIKGITGGLMMAAVGAILAFLGF